MIRFIHTADVHLDAPLTNLSSIYEVRQDDFRRTMRRMRDVVIEKQVDFWLIAGDLLEYHGGTRATALFLRELFESMAPIPIFISPGNHDPWQEGSFYQTMEWPAHVHIFTDEWGVYEYPEKSCVLYGWGFPQAHVTTSPLDTFPGKLPDYRFHLMVIHGSVVTGEHMDHSVYAPMTIGGLADTGVNYVALGHIHKPMQFLHPQTKQVLAAYPGSPEGLSIKESGERYAIFGTISDTGVVTIEPISVESRIIKKMTISLKGLETVDTIVERVERELSQENKDYLLHVTFAGERASHLHVPLEIIKARCKDYFFIQFTDLTYPDIDEQQVREKGGVFGKWLEKLNDLEQATTDEREKAVIQLAKREALQRIGGVFR
ncbi:DNA repair exonuclease [Brevibacillus laterosporus]|uniref:DNA repair exonuclease n=1 Tax=Brevibacillus laterosporus TaxID=1465 RepID=A0A518V2T6_BRELA|nr:DNA repair exonuclease [Brevibacillus laterosporus]